MIKIGQFNNLKVIKKVSFGVYLDGGEWGEILLPQKFVPDNIHVEEALNAFVYFDSQDKIIATTQRPRALVGRFAFLKVVDVNRFGAFLDWGLDKDLLVPKPEQARPMEPGKSYLVYLTLDKEGRIMASSKIDKFLDNQPAHFQQGDEVSLLIAEATPLGNKVIINHTHWGLIHTADIFQNLSCGQKIQGYIKTIREDGKIDVTLRKIGQDSILELAKRILIELEKKGGFLPLHDKSSSHDIKHVFSESKKSFKRAIGYLYKQAAINIEPNGIRLRKKQR